MIKKLRLKFTFVCSLGMGIILIAICVFYFSLSETQLKNQSETIVKNNLNSIVYKIQDNKIIDNAWLSQLEAGNKIIVHIEDGKYPLSFRGSYKTITSRDILIADAQEKALSEYGFNTRIKPESIINVSSIFFEITGQHKELYKAALAVVPMDSSWQSVIVLRDLKQDYDAMAHTRLVFFIAILFLTVIMFYFSWWFSGKTIQPIEKSHRQQMEFVASASHELRSPVTVMGLSIASLEKSKNEEDTNKFISSLKHECTRMSRLVNDLLTLASSDINTLPLNSEKFDVQTLLLSLYEHYTSLAASNGLKLSISLPDCTIPVLNGDYQRLYQALGAILDNALFYTPYGGNVELGYYLGRKKLTIYVSDTGIGIKDENKSKIFDRFFREDPSRSKKEHYGLGLSIAKEIIHSHSGKIYIKDREGGGSTFVVVLPVTN